MLAPKCRMERQEHTYCGICARPELKEWQGWPHKKAIPLLPRILGDTCEACGSAAERIASGRITWFNYHGEFNTGLPDYWLLVIDGERLKWGLPYFAEGVCPRCSSRTIISQMNFPNGTSELKHNCAACGIRSLR